MHPNLFFITTIITLLTTLSVSSCSNNTIPDLSRLYNTPELPDRPHETDSTQLSEPVILIHGAFGSRLNDKKTGEEYWPGNLWRILFSEYEDIALTFDDKTLMPTTSNLVATDVTDQVAGKDYYGAIIRTLEQVGGYTRGEPGKAPIPDTRQYSTYKYVNRLSKTGEKNIMNTWFCILINRSNERAVLPGHFLLQHPKQKTGISSLAAIVN